MSFHRPASLAEALAVKAEDPRARLLAGGTDVMVAANFGRLRPKPLVDLTAVPELSQWWREKDRVVIGATVPYQRIIEEIGQLVPGLALASRTVGSPQIRNRGTVGGNLGTASPAGDAHPPLLASRASLRVASVHGSRVVPIDDFFVGLKKTTLADDEIVTAVDLPVAAGPQQFSKVGTRNAMVIAVCSFALALDPVTGQVGTGIGSAAPTPRRTPAAEAFLAAELSGRWANPARPLPHSVVKEFGELVAQAAAPIDDVRSTAAYRKHALAVLARRTLTWTWLDYQKEARQCA
ncbi:FAD binding domain-containing protein [Fodinicola acaciae]|uniref:FAD binding domain-containing protein n=1 Tax=Fodinicola acaciae TaxID=2681555 RepID=UPI0013D1281B|nr:FAD binding domain-containing protein [Fodinicola acaciae]